MSNTKRLTNINIISVQLFFTGKLLEKILTHWRKTLQKSCRERGRFEKEESPMPLPSPPPPSQKNIKKNRSPGRQLLENLLRRKRL